MNLEKKQIIISDAEKNMVQELFTIACLYFISKKINFSVKNSASSESKYIKLTATKQTIRISNHWQENCKEIQVITLYDLAKVYLLI